MIGCLGLLSMFAGVVWLAALDWRLAVAVCLILFGRACMAE